jgi:hypothetical protein
MLFIVRLKLRHRRGRPIANIGFHKGLQGQGDCPRGQSNRQILQSVHCLQEILGRNPAETVIRTATLAVTQVNCHRRSVGMRQEGRIGESCPHCGVPGKVFLRPGW